MRHGGYVEKRKDLAPLIESICGWAERNWCVGGIAWHKVEDLEKRLCKAIPEPCITTHEVVKDLHSAWRMLREITGETEPDKRQHLIELARIFMADK